MVSSYYSSWIFLISISDWNSVIHGNSRKLCKISGSLSASENDRKENNITNMHETEGFLLVWTFEIRAENFDILISAENL